MKALVNQDTCIGCGICMSMCPDVFHSDDDGKACTKDEEVAKDLEDGATEARDSCPVDAIDIKA